VRRGEGVTWFARDQGEAGGVGRVGEENNNKLQKVGKCNSKCIFPLN
jgi:hypothetical protein